MCLYTQPTIINDILGNEGPPVIQRRTLRRPRYFVEGIAVTVAELALVEFNKWPLAFKDRCTNHV